MADDLFPQLIALWDKGGLPAIAVGGLIGLVVKFGKKESPDTQLAAALKELTGEFTKLRLEITDRFARIESDVKHLERERGDK
jgi:uncharacterized membrane-anchored protein YhcB (DUF1043 family)